MLEVIDKGECSESHPVPLPLVYGARPAAWCWDEHFLDFFADKGYRALAVSLRGHGNSPTPSTLHRSSSWVRSATAPSPPTKSARLRAYNAEPQLFPDVGHDMMLEPGWDAVAKRIHSCL
jgi:hypothetical protein